MLGIGQLDVLDSSRGDEASGMSVRRAMVMSVGRGLSQSMRIIPAACLVIAMVEGVESI
jgi:hypothetical protein